MRIRGNPGLHFNSLVIDNFFYSIEGGFSSLSPFFPGTSTHCPFDTDKLARDASAPLSDILLLKLYKQMETELDRLPRPTIIVCKSNRRAGAVVAAYKGVKNCIVPQTLLRLYSEDGMN